MNILMVTPETVPFSKSGGLADVVYALSTVLANKGHDVKVLMPLYGFIDKDGFEKKFNFKVKMGAEKVNVNILTQTLDNVEFLALEHDVFTSRKGIYGDSSFTPYFDNSYRFLLLSSTVNHYLEESQFKVDVVHAHDWTVGLVPYMLKDKIKTVFTIHNLAYQGIFSKYDLLFSSLTPKEKMFTSNKYNKNLNMMKAGIESADIITTVSKTYAEEIQSKKFGCDLEELLKNRKNDLFGITNGIDLNEWNPESDKYLEYNYSINDLSGKKAMKELVLRKHGLEVNEKPLIVSISRLAEQKGFDELLLSDVLENILKEDSAQFIILGTGDERYQSKLQFLSEKYSNLAVNITFSNELSHKLEAAADMFLMPSKYEPCGLNQLYSMRYGTLPIVHATGGLKDTVIDIENNGFGFVFDNMSVDTLQFEIQRAIKSFKTKEFSNAVVKAMKQNFSWEKSASEYEKLYK